MMHRARELLIRQRTMLVNALRGHLAEFGLIEAQGLHKVARLVAIVMDESGRARTGDGPSGAEGDRRPDRRYPDSGSLGSRSRFSRGTRATRSASVSPPFRASGRSSPRRSPRRLQIRTYSAVAESLPPGSGWCRDRTRPAARRGSVELANEATVISAVCSSTAHTRCCFARRRPRLIPG